MDHEKALCEIHRLDDAATLADVARALEVRGVEADVWPEHRVRLVPLASRTWRLMVRCADVVYARWVAAAAGLDTWGEENGRDDAPARSGL